MQGSPNRKGQTGFTRATLNFNKNMNPFIDAIESLLTKALLLIFTPEFIFLRDSNLKGPRCDVYHEIPTRNLQGCTFSPPLSKLSKVCVEIFDTVSLMKIMKLARRNINKTNNLVFHFGTSKFEYTAINAESRLELRGDFQVHPPDSHDYERFVAVCRNSAAFADNFPTRSNLLEMSFMDIKRIHNSVRKREEGSYIDLDFHESHLSEILTRPFRMADLSVRDGQDLGQDMKTSILQLAKDRLKKYEACAVLKELKRDNIIRSQLPIKVLQTLFKLMKKGSSNLLLYVTDMVTKDTPNLDVGFTHPTECGLFDSQSNGKFRGVIPEDQGLPDQFGYFDESNSITNSLRKHLEDFTPGTENRSNSGPVSQNHKFGAPSRISNISHQQIHSNRSSGPNIFFPQVLDESNPESSRVSFGFPGDFRMEGDSFINTEQEAPKVFDAARANSPFMALKMNFLRNVTVNDFCDKFVMSGKIPGAQIKQEGAGRHNPPPQGMNSMSLQQAPPGRQDGSNSKISMGFKKAPKTAVNRIPHAEPAPMVDEFGHMVEQLFKLAAEDVKKAKEQNPTAPNQRLQASDIPNSDWFV